MDGLAYFSTSFPRSCVLSLGRFLSLPFIIGVRKQAEGWGNSGTGKAKTLCSGSEALCHYWACLKAKTGLGKQVAKVKKLNFCPEVISAIINFIELLVSRKGEQIKKPLLLSKVCMSAKVKARSQVVSSFPLCQHNPRQVYSEVRATLFHKPYFQVTIPYKIAAFDEQTTLVQGSANVYLLKCAGFLLSPTAVTGTCFWAEPF